MIQMDGEWVHEDVTFNDMGDETYIEDFFPSTNLTSIEVFQFVKNDPDRAEMKLRTPASTSDSANYYVRKEQTLGAGWQGEIVQRVQKAHDEGRHAIGFRFTDSAAFEEAVSMIESRDSHVFVGLTFPAAVDYVRYGNVLYIHWD